MLKQKEAIFRFHQFSEDVLKFKTATQAFFKKKVETILGRTVCRVLLNMMIWRKYTTQESLITNC